MNEQEDDFAAMFEASVQARRVAQGQQIEGTIVAIGPEVALVSIGGKSEAQIDIAELKDEDGDIEVSVGDRIQAVVVSTGGGIMLSRRGIRNAATQRELENAREAGRLAPRDPERDAWLINKLVMTVFHHYAFAEDDESAATVAEDVWAFCLAGISGTPSAPPAKRPRRTSKPRAAAR